MITMSAVTGMPGVPTMFGIRAMATWGVATDLLGVTLTPTMSVVTVMPRAVVLIVTGAVAVLRAVDGVRVSTAG